jgi:hypothetical protein
LRQNDNYLLLAGAFASAFLALLCDFALGLIEKSYKIGERPAPHRKFLIAGAAAIFALIIGASHLPGFQASSTTTLAAE